MKNALPPPCTAIAGVLGLAVLSLAFSPPAQAIVLIGNLPEQDDNYGQNFPNSNSILAMGFILPSDSDYSLHNVVLRLGGYDSTDTLTVQIRDDGGINPGINSLVSFASPTGLGSSITNYTFTPDSAFTFTAGTKYWLVVQGGNTGSFSWRGSLPSILPTGIATLNNFRRSGDGGASYSDGTLYTSFQINVAKAAPVPFESDALPVVGSALFMAGGLWWKKKRSQANVAEFVAKK